MAESGLSSGVRWSGISVVGREVSRSVFTIVLARIVGPDDFGIVVQAMVYIGIVGLAARPGFLQCADPAKAGRAGNARRGCFRQSRGRGGADGSDNRDRPAVGLVHGHPTADARAHRARAQPADPVRGNHATRDAHPQHGVPEDGDRRHCRRDVRGVLGVIVAVAGGSYWAVVVQIVCTDVVLLLVLLAFRTGWRPNLHFRELGKIAAFSGRAFAAGLLTNSVSRNIDNLLVGRFQGAEALAFYALAYRLLLLPVQLASLSIGTVLFPTFARLAEDVATLGAEMARVTRALAALSLPAMALVAAAAPQLVAVFFGPQWEPAIPIVQVLAIAGALQAIYQPSTIPLVLGLGHAKLNLRYAWLTTVVTTVGIVAGLPFGPFGVAVGYCAATVLLVPVEWLIRRHLIA